MKRIRRKILLHDLSEVNDEFERLLRMGYVQHGNWSLGQMGQHLRLTIDANVDGYPKWMTIAGFPLRPLLQRLVLPRLLRGDSPAGIRTAPRFVPPEGLDDTAEVLALAQSIERYQLHRERLHPHPGFGRLSPDQFDRFHAAHASHHLSFLGDKTDQ
ncbi:hypothetical protein Pla22_35100 [Rubripirellula amarantea]|uniref:DUF1569 domain-containing protein n=1 Tax=Rubripirellula amarantea TaxID=2527999 RepID=A0A5C5WJM2_9BACT|nr:DUF1569 domain-containing protein [Rubripirellula amarantea]TWT50767.1 hypothetical protein Pla22_35100 [Rubripirellula amarantea]